MLSFSYKFPQQERTMCKSPFPAFLFALQEWFFASCVTRVKKRKNSTAMTAPHFFWNQPELGSETMESGMTAASPCPVCPARRNRNHRRVAYLIAGMLSASSHSNIPYARADMSSPTLRASNTVSMRDTAFQCVTHAVLPHRSAYRSEPRPHDSSMDICEHIIPNPVLFRLWWDDDSWRRNRFSCERPRTTRQRHCMQRWNHENIQHWTIKPHPYGLHCNRHSGWHAIIRGVGMLVSI